MDPEIGKGLGGGAIEEMGPDLAKPEPEARSPLYLPPSLAAERKAQAEAQEGKIAKITVPIRAMMTHLDEPGWGDQCLAMIKEQLVRQGANDGTLIQILLADHLTLNLPEAAIAAIEEGQPPGGVRANWAPGFKRKKRRKAAKPSRR